MSKRDMLLEIGLEEMPARFVTDSMNQLGSKVEEFLQEQKVSYEGITLYSTPRRLAVLVQGVAEAQEDIEEEAKGPAKKIALQEDGSWSKAAIGFTRGQGVTVEDIYFKEINGVEYVHVNKFIKGQPTIDLLPKLRDIVVNLHFGKNMRWANNDLRYIRPIKWIVALFGSDVIPFEITNVVTDRITKGHRFLGDTITITAPAEYEVQLKKQFVIVDPAERKAMIRRQLSELEAEKSWVIPVDEELLEEVNNLVEYPTALSGSFNKEFLELPEEVLITSMKEHQRYFPVKDKEGTLLPYFVTVRNGDSRSLDVVARGNEKVLRARLADADFFYKEDQSKEIDFFLNKLQTIVYHEKIGTLSEKVSRIRRLAAKLSELTGASKEVQQKVDRAAEICKFDLVTQMVYEFPELQGIMGEKYAQQKGEDSEVARAVNEHYEPRHADDETPETFTGAIVSLADKLDTIVSCFAVDIIPTGSQDPYALRRQAAGVVLILAEKKWSISLETVLQTAIGVVKEDNVGEKEAEALLEELVSFFKLRVKHSLQEREIRYDLIDAVLAGPVGSLPSLFAKADVLMAHKEEEGFKETTEALSRVVNIAKKAEVIGEIDEQRFENEEEKVLHREFLRVQKGLKEVETAEQQFTLLESLKQPIEQYFDHTMVMAEETAVRENRLNQMKALSVIILSFADFNKILVK
ncbi:glycine--tRNA ligase subunit beta [Pseudobacillus wudalianchiensis]|uniref:Glycine--tRNA ligase beta subunit n=1 Tax=Pseudobacillus wudalianchiensis TaxID=1743143 RepID=A0A1B9B8X7_9BACI|nr:glycine--tRNA ligase subunit beta [Bacillus wudalianchiensis]OCA92522.1 glycine--tRNA ligase subunit beta [Bacillus wudalianchiensis]